MIVTVVACSRATTVGQPTTSPPQRAARAQCSGSTSTATAMSTCFRPRISTTRSRGPMCPYIFRNKRSDLHIYINNISNNLSTGAAETWSYNMISTAADRRPGLGVRDRPRRRRRRPFGVVQRQHDRVVREHRRERRELELIRPEIPTAPTPTPIPAPTPVPIPLPTPVPTPGPSAVGLAYAGPVGQVFRPRRAFRREVDRNKCSWLCCECSAHFRKPQLSGVLSGFRTARIPADRRVQSEPNVLLR